ncbi:hypothetical protein C2845_PM16G03250 [Panicum miliaceum]|uniref:Uncharacterized protein n=1 Tax=Panicum miliaceum TaxID=4540 RepID=A0A3L6PTT0_PANMI|nr:hypothetical protein C2845_PM16G03250 [Panicum miliaceum]
MFWLCSQCFSCDYFPLHYATISESNVPTEFAHPVRTASPPAAPSPVTLAGRLNNAFCHIEKLVRLLGGGTA